MGGGCGLALVIFYTNDSNLKKKVFGGDWKMGVWGGAGVREVLGVVDGWTDDQAQTNLLLQPPRC